MTQIHSKKERLHRLNNWHGWFINYPCYPELFMHELKSRDTLPISENRYMSLISRQRALTHAKNLGYE
jgi:hypothetical protein